MTELTIRDHFQPAMSRTDAVERFNAVAGFAREVLREGIDFGKIPGTDRPTLLKPGAEKLTTFFGLTVRFIVLEKIEDWSGDQHGGEPLFYYVYRCQLYRGDLLIAESDASCNSRESKYRWRSAERLCPECGKPTIIKGKAEYGGGFLCFGKKGGCGAKFSDHEPAILEQVVGRVFNPDIFDQVNTIQKMSQKRSLIAATLLAVNASEFFTQDMEDLPAIEVHSSPVTQAQGIASGSPVTQRSAPPPPAAPAARPTGPVNGPPWDDDGPGLFDEPAPARPIQVKECRNCKGEITWGKIEGRNVPFNVANGQKGSVHSCGMGGGR